MVSLAHNEGECPVNNDNFLIEENDLELARDICKYIENPDIRNRAVANAIAGNIAEKYFTEVEIDTKSGLHNISYVLKDLEIADIYINNCYIDVKLYFNENEIFVPKSLFDKGIAPVAFMFIKITPDLSGGSVTGFISSNEIDLSDEQNGYYRIDESELTSFYDIEPLLIDKQLPEFVDNIDKKIFSFLEGSMENVDEFYQELINSKDARERLAIAAKAQSIFNLISVTQSENKADVENNTEGASEGEEIEDFSLNLEADSIEPLSLDANVPTELNFDENITEPLNEIDDQIEASENFILDTEPESFELEASDIVSELEEASGNELEENTVTVAESDDEAPADTVSEELDDNIKEVESEEILNIDESISSNPTEFNMSNYDEISTIEDINAEPLITEELTEYNPAEAEEAEPSPYKASEIPEYKSDKEGNDAGNEFNYSTETTPSLNTIDNNKDSVELDIANLESLLDNEPKQDVQEEPNNNNENIETSPQIDRLFGQSSENEDLDDNVIAESPKKKTSKLLPVVGAIAVLGAIGYYSYTKFVNPAPADLPLPPNDLKQTQAPKSTAPKTPVQEAMPVETIENIEKPTATEEAASVSIPAIEQNLDASILVSNLSVNWEVPSGYVSNNTAKRYFLKLGKIIQLNLKTELLLLSKPPITNKIAVEIEYNKNTKKFEVKGITESSGEKSVDDIILKTVNNALNINLRMNTSSFGNIAGNPVLVIHL